MNCKCVSQKLGGYLDGELAGSEMLALRNHLNRCDACAEEAESLRSLKSALSNLPCASPPEGLEERLLAAVRLESRPVFAPRRLGFYWTTALAAAATAGFLCVWLGLAGSREASGSTPVASESSFELSRDQAFQAAADPLGGHSMVVTASYDK